MKSVESQPTFRRDISPPSSGLHKPIKMASRLDTFFNAVVFLGLLDPEDGGDMFLLNVG
jgi:hypothetical protein